MRNKKHFQLGVGLFEAMLVSCLVVAATYAAVQARLSLGFVTAGNDSRAQVGKAMVEYSNLLYQVAGDLTLARNRSFGDWQAAVGGVCRDMVNESQRIASIMNNPAQAATMTDRSILTIWHQNFASAVPFMNLKLTDCNVTAATGGMHLLHISVGYQWQDFQDGAAMNATSSNPTCEPGYRCERFHLSVVKPG